MSTTTVSQVPAHIAARIAARAEAGVKASLVGSIVKGDFAFPKISIRASRFRLVEDGVETPVGTNLDVIIVGVNPNVSKVFYAKAFDGSDGVRPDCFSNDGLRADDSVETPVHSNCATCPNNVLGSKMLPSGAKSKICAGQRHLAVVPAADPTKAYGLTIAVSAMKNLREYFKELQNYGLDAHEVVTELGFDEQSNYPKVTFSRKAYPPEKLLSAIDKLKESDEVKIAVRTMAPKGATALAAPPKAAAIAAPKAKPAPAIEEGYEEESTPMGVVNTPEPEPTVENAPKAAKAAPKAVSQDISPDAGSSELEKQLDEMFGDD